MKKILLTEGDMERVRELRQKGVSWLGIEKTTNITRHVAKREYERWLRSSTANELRGIRLQLAEQEFKKHTYDLLEMAARVVSYLTVPDLRFKEIRSAEEQFDEMLKSFIFNDFGMPNDMPLSEQQSRKRNLTMLIEALRVHVQEKLQGDFVKEWAKAWDGCIAAFTKLKRDAVDTTNDILVNGRQQPLLLDKVLGKENRELETSNISYYIILGLLAVMKQEERIHGALQATPVRTPTPREIQEKVYPQLVPRTVSEVERDRAKNERVKDVVTEYKVLTEALLTRIEPATIKSALLNYLVVDNLVFEIKDVMNPLKLYPMMLRTRCELCPI